MPDYADVTLTIDLEALAENYRVLAEKSSISCAAVVKANAYGLGMAQVAPKLAKAGCGHFFVAMLDEAVELRNILKKEDIFAFHGLRKGQEEAFHNERIIPVLNTLEEIALWRGHAQKLGEMLPAVVHVDTGMNRLGLSLQEAEALAQEKDALAGLTLHYVMSHLSCASQADHPMNKSQREQFHRVRQWFPGIPASFSNSAGIYLGDDYHYDLTRPGCSLYGVSPVAGRQDIVKQVATLRAQIIGLHRINSPQAVGYGATQEVPAGTVLATVSVGYADGYLRSLSNRATGWIGGVEVPLAGRVSMDLTIFDVTGIPEADRRIGAEIELLGAHIPVDKVAEKAGTIGYEILTGLSRRYKKVYE